LEHNIFGIPSPEAWECYVEFFAIGHAEMTILARTPDNAYSIRIKFFQVDYFSGLIRWRSVNFQLGAQEECHQLLETVPRFTKPIHPELFTLYQLYEVATPSGTLKIVAAATEIMDRNVGVVAPDTSPSP
jgi:hypothetical protein